MKRFFLLLAMSAAMALALPAQEKTAEKNAFRTASVFSDHMVLQCSTQAPVWGLAAPGAKVTVTTSWDKAKYSCTAGNDGRWETKVSTPAPGGPYSVTVSTSGKDKIVFSDVMSGEVWLCTGQSNMQMPVIGFPSQGVEGSRENVLDAPEYAGRIRVYDIKADKAFEPQENVPYSWKLSDGEVTAQTSAIAYLFAKRLTKSLGVPVGIIVSPWGGCLLEPWMNKEYLDKEVKEYISEDAYNAILSKREDKTNAPRQLGTMYNARMYPVKGYAIKGFLWYQGCSNRGGYWYYDKLQKAMVDCWRNMWGDSQNKLPFYFVAIAPFGYGDPDSPLNGYFIENQLSSLDEIPNSGAAVTQTLGDKGCIHPAKKQQVADQLVMLALEKTYGVKTGIGSGFPYPDVVEFPAYSSVSAGKIRKSGFEIDLRKRTDSDKNVRVHFANASLGLGHYSDYGFEVKGFEVAGPDNVFRAVPAKSQYDAVVLDCSEIADPVAVRYAFHNYCEANLVNTAGVPVPSFRTDNLPLN